jgi:transglutaminase-like putative cysteine protease
MILMCCSVSYGSTAQEENSIENVKLPPNWTVQKIAEAPKETLIGLSQKLGGELVSAKNYLIHLRYETPPWGAPQYSIENAEKISQEDDIVSFSVDEPQYKLGIPYIEIQATIPVKFSAYYTPRSEINKSHLTAETPYWPANDTKIKELLGRIIQSEMTTEQRIKAIHGWVREHIKYGGERIGTRYGVAQVLQQGFGRCWGLCDVFVTLCRAAKIPARQVMGWIYGKSGHVWVEAYIDEKGWCLLDSTTPSGGVTTDYVPFFISEDGEMPAVYWALPQLEIHKTP